MRGSKTLEQDEFKTQTLLQVRVPPGEDGWLQMHAISNPLSPENGDLRVVLSGHFCASLHVGHARSIRPVFDYRITGVEAQIKTKQTKEASAGLLYKDFKKRSQNNYAC